MHKVAIFNSSGGERWSAGRYLYCNKPCINSQSNTSYSSSIDTVDEIVPPDDLGIDNPDALRILKVKPGYLKGLQKKVFEAVSAKHYLRIDFRMSNQVPYVIDINMIPGLSPNGYMAKCMKEHGIEYNDFIRMVVNSAF